MRVRSSAGPFGPLLAWMISLGFNRPLHHLRRRRGACGRRHERRDRPRGAGRHHANMSPSCTSSFAIFWNSCFKRGVGEVEVEVVHEQQDAAGSVVGWPRRQVTSFLRRRRRRQQLVEDAPVHQGEGGDLLASTPSSNTSNSSFFKSATNWPPSSRAMTSVVTRSMATRNVGCDPARLCRGPTRSQPPEPAPGRRSRRRRGLRCSCGRAPSAIAYRARMEHAGAYG